MLNLQVSLFLNANVLTVRNLSPSTALDRFSCQVNFDLRARGKSYGVDVNCNV
jgi:hypothetical protein